MKMHYSLEVQIRYMNIMLNTIDLLIRNYSVYLIYKIS